MNTDIKTKWLAALRSGNFTQVRCTLKSEIGHCCLGVLAEVIGCKWEPLFNGKGFGVIMPGQPDIDIRRENKIGELAGMSRDSITTCIRMNDTNKSSFNEIADWVEANEDDNL